MTFGPEARETGNSRNNGDRPDYPPGIFVVQKSVTVLATLDPDQESWYPPNSRQRYMEIVTNTFGSDAVHIPHVTLLDTTQTGLILGEYGVEPDDPEADELFEAALEKIKGKSLGDDDKRPKSTRMQTTGAVAFPREEGQIPIGFQLDEEAGLHLRAQTEAVFDHFGVEPAHTKREPRVITLTTDDQQYARYIAESLNKTLGNSVEVIDDWWPEVEYDLPGHRLN